MGTRKMKRVGARAVVLSTRLVLISLEGSTEAVSNTILMSSHLMDKEKVQKIFP